MTRLGTIRRELESLRVRRQTVRIGTAICGLALIVLWLMGLAFLLDVTLQMAVAQRAAFMILYAVVAVWAVRKFVLPWLGHRETDIDMALLVEKHQKIDSELVAALQFESAGAEQWGSPRLRTAVVEYVAEYGRNWNFLEGVPTDPLKIRGALLAVTLIVAAGVTLMWPGHVSAFMQRLCLLNVRYPSQTRIVEVKLKSELGDLPARNDGYRGPYGKKLTFEFLTQGTLPEEGTLEIVSENEHRAPITIHKTKRASDDGTWYEASLDRLLKPLSFQAYLNDTWTESNNVAVIPTPLVELKLHATAPEYARGIVSNEAPSRERQISVLQGSQVDVQVICANKTLTSVQLLTKATANADWTVTQLAVGDSAGRGWSLAGTESPFRRVDHDMLYEIVVKDEDGLATDGEITGMVRIKADRKPAVSAVAASGTTRVLPQAKPRFDITATDDFAIAKLSLHVEVTRQAEGTGVAEPATKERPDVADLPIPVDRAPLLMRDGRLPYKLEKFVLPLEPYQLTKGDQVRLFFEATDYRGDLPGETSRSDAIVLTVTDDSGIIAGITERDEAGVRQIDEINKTQLGTGGSK